MKFLRQIILYGALVVVSNFWWKTPYVTACDRIIKYDIGNFDEEFRLDRDVFLTTLEFAEMSWETVAGKNIFQYTPGADFKVNLIFSDEQQLLYEGNDISSKLSSKENSIGTIQDRYQSAVNRFEQAVLSYETKLKKYEKEVDYWNGQGGAPQDKYATLQKEAVLLDKKVNEINNLREKVNELTETNNAEVEQYNDGVAHYNNLFANSHEFDAGNTDGTEINIYSYDGNQGLQTLLMHEFGHVLGIDHIDDEKSVMYYLLNNLSQKGELSELDKAALQETCRL